MPTADAEHLEELRVLVPAIIPHLLPAQGSIPIGIDGLKQGFIALLPVQIHVSEVGQELIATDFPVFVAVHFAEKVLPTSNAHLHPSSFIVVPNILPQLPQGHKAIPIGVDLVKNLAKFLL